MQARNNHPVFSALAVILATCLASACGKEVCEKDVGPISEVTVKFKGFSLSQAATLEIDITVKDGPPARGTNARYYSRRISRVVFPESARDGSATFVFEPGTHIMNVAASVKTAERFSMVVWLRVFDSSGLMLAEGRYGVSGDTKKCWLNRSMTVSASQTCADKTEGDACPSRSGTPYVCRDSGSGLACEASSCGDGFLDSQHGEACETGNATGIECGTNCLPTFMDRTVKIVVPPGNNNTPTPPQWYEVLPESGAPPPRYLAKGEVFAPTDPVNATFVLFGGQDASGVPMADTWLFDGESWEEHIQIEPTPGARYGHAMAYDPERNVLLLFGGSDEANPTSIGSFEDLWEFVPGTGWEARSPIGPSPGPRYGAAMAYHPSEGRFVLFGGHLGSTSHTTTPVPAGCYTFYLEYTGSEYEWQQGTETHCVATPPASLVRPNIRHHTITWAPGLEELLLVGGQTSETSGGSDGVFRYDQGIWEPRATNQSRRVSRHQALVVPDMGDLLIVGGIPNQETISSGGGRYRTIQSLTSSGWSILAPSNHQPPRSGHVAFYLPGPEALFTFGGRIELTTEATSPVALANDTWLLHADPYPTNPFVATTGLKVGPKKMTNVRGFYDLGRGDPASASEDVVATMTVADFDGDGVDEVALGFPGGSSTGQVTGDVLIEDPLGMDRTIATDGAVQVISGIDKAKDWPWGSWLGGAMAGGDLNGDGAIDLVVGGATRQSMSAADDTSGAIYVIWGGGNYSISPDKTSTPIQVSTGTSAPLHVTIFGETGGATQDPPSDRFGYALAVGDFDGDGHTDIAVSAPERSAGAGAPSAGAVYVLSGATLAGIWPSGQDPAAVDDLPRKENQSPTPDPLVLRSATPYLRLGVSLAAGDIDGDGVTDLLVGSATTSGDATCDTGTPACGAFAIIYGREGLFGGGGRELSLEALSPSDGALAQAGDNSLLYGLGGVVALVDLDSDGYSEVVTALGRPNTLTGGPHKIALFRGQGLSDALSGSSSAALATHLVLHAPPGPLDRSGFGAFLAAGDVNGDRRQDLLVGAPFEGMELEHLGYGANLRPLQNVGALYVLLGSRLASYWDPDGSGELYVEDLMDFTSEDEVSFPLVRIRGSIHNGFLGASAGTHSHYARPLDQPRSSTLLVQPGWFNASTELSYQEQFQGRVYLADLQSLLQ
ncbi:MAG: FG-GAP-like repeat-containing protein [Polyangia bacterium]|jgi:hypothetical protein|nr:FG-GAP-like repeat-containing protein [Polyangia bacterium]